MKRHVPLALVLMILPAGAGAEITLDRSALQRATPVTALFGETVRGSDDSRQGEVDDVLIRRDGSVESILIERNIYTVDHGYETSTPINDPETYRGPDIVGPTSDIENSTYVTIAASDAEYAQASDSLQLNAAPASLNRQQEPRRESAPGLLHASNIVGMEVHLLDDPSFGRIEDVMLSRDLTRVVAYVIDNWDGLDKQRRALPADKAHIDQHGGDVAFEYSLQQVRDVPEFNLDRYTDDGWDVL